MKHDHARSAQRFTIITTALLAGSLLLTACGSAGTGATATTAATNAATTEATAEVMTEATAETTTEATSEAAAEATTETTTEAATEAATAEASAAVHKLNLNEVTGEQLLAAIPNFGNRMVREFQEYRPYVSIQQFRKEIGKYVDEAQVAEYEKYVYVPINVNEADEATLQQLPGVDAAAAAELVAGRPYASDAAFLEKLAQVAPGSDAAAAAAYLEGE